MINDAVKKTVRSILRPEGFKKSFHFAENPKPDRYKGAHAQVELHNAGNKMVVVVNVYVRHEGDVVRWDGYAIPNLGNRQFSWRMEHVKFSGNAKVTEVNEQIWHAAQIA